MDDARIVRLYWDRNEQAIPAAADKYGNYSTSIAKNILGNHEDAEGGWIYSNDTVRYYRVTEEMEGWFSELSKD